MFKESCLFHVYFSVTQPPYIIDLAHRNLIMFVGYHAFSLFILQCFEATSDLPTVSYNFKSLASLEETPKDTIVGEWVSGGRGSVYSIVMSSILYWEFSRFLFFLPGPPLLPPPPPHPLPDVIGICSECPDVQTVTTKANKQVDIYVHVYLHCLLVVLRPDNCLCYWLDLIPTIHDLLWLYGVNAPPHLSSSLVLLGSISIV